MFFPFTLPLLSVLRQGLEDLAERRSCSYTHRDVALESCLAKQAVPSEADSSSPEPGLADQKQALSPRVTEWFGSEGSGRLKAGAA